MPPVDKRLMQYLASLGADPTSLVGWTVHTAQRDGEDVGFVITRGPEIHCLPLVEGKSLTRRNIIGHIAPLLEKFCYVTTRVPIAETDHRLRTALGFEQTWADADCTYWALTRLKYAHKNKGVPPCL